MRTKFKGAKIPGGPDKRGDIVGKWRGMKPTGDAPKLKEGEKVI